jgi:restriction system protein
MPKRSPSSSWNPAIAASISPKDYEKQVVTWLRAATGKLEKFEVEHLRHLSGAGGYYEFDAVAEFTILNGAKIVVLVECKRYSSPVEREKLLSLWAKTQDVKAHKAMIFATCGFQSGALNYAKTYGIATIAFVEGSFLYETKSKTPSGRPPSWIGLPDYAGIFIVPDNSEISFSTIYMNNIEPLSKWLMR